MKKIVAYILIGILCIAAAAGVIYGVNYKKANTKPSEIVEEQEDLSSEDALKKAEKYLKTIYKDVEKETPRDYERIGVVPIGKFKFPVTWSVDVSEEYVKVVVNENGIVTIDVNEECSEDVPYVLTATIKDEKGNIRKLTWEHVIPKKITGTYQEIVDMAYALKPGESLPNEATLQGTVTTINTPWDSGYKNITVTITVEGREDKPIQCYRLKSGAADASQIEKGDLITVTGILKNYNGTIEFDAGCVLDANEKGAGTILKVSGTMQEIVDKAYALKDGESLKGEATLTGTVTAINTAWSDQYKNISVTIAVEGREDKPIQCYRLKSGAADASKIAKGDLITVTGTLKNFKGTIEFDAGCTLDKNEKGKGTIIKVEGSMQEIVDKAYALKDGEVLKGEATLTGTVTAINTAWSADFKNISVTIVVEGREDKPIQCYRMKSGAADASKVAKGDLITVTGLLKNFKGTIEFDAGCTLEANKKGAGTIDTVAGTYQEIVDKAYELKEGEVLKGEATLQGTVTAVGSEWSDQYKNITVTIVVEGREDKPIECYRMKSGAADASKVEKGDLITVTGMIKNYNGKIEFDAGCTLEANKKGAGTIETVTGTMQEIVDKAYALEVGSALEGEATLTGSVTKVDTPYSEQYSNVTVTIVVDGRESKPIKCYRLKGTNADKVAAGDLITVTGIIKNYNGTIEFDQGCEMTNWVQGGGTYVPEEPDVPDVPVVPDQPDVPVVPTTAYKMSMYQGKVDKTVYFTGAMDGFYLATSENIEDAVDIYKEEVEGGEYLYFMVGDTANYLYIFKNGTYTNAGLTEDVSLASVFVLNEEYNTYVTTVEGNEFFLGTRNDKTYTTIGACGVNYISSNFKAVLEAVEVPEETPTAYKMSMYQGKVDKTVYFTGAMDGFYLATSENIEDAVDIYKEEVEGGEYLYFMVGDTANYLYIFKNGTYTNAGLTEDVSLASVFVLNEEYNTYVTTVEGNEFFLGTRNDKTYTTIGACGVNYISSNFKAVLEAVEVPEETPTAYKMSMYQGKVDKTVYFTGAMDGFYLATSENIEDAVDIYKEEVEGGEYLYFMVGDTANYLYIFKNGTYTNAGLTEDVSLASVFVLNEEYNTYVTTVEGNEFFLGTRNDKTYTTIGACDVNYISSNFKAVLEEVEDNETDTAATLADAIAGLQAEYTAEMNVTGEYVLSPSIAIDGTEFTITWSIQTANEAVAKIVDGKLVVAAGTEDVEYTLTATVEDATGATDTWTKTATVAKVVEAESIQAGDRVILWIPKDMLALTADKASYKYNGSAVTLSEDVLSYDENACVFVVETTDAGYYKFKLESTGEYLSAYASGNYINLGYNGEYPEWELIKLDNGTYNIKNATCPESSYGPYFLEYYSGWTVYAKSEEAAASDTAFQLGIYVVPETEEDDNTPAYFTKVTEAPTDWSGTYLIVYEDDQKVFDGSLTTLDAGNNFKDVTIADGKIEATDEVKAAQVTIAKLGDNYTIKSASGYFIGNTSDANKLYSNTSTQYENTIALNTEGTVDVVAVNGGTYLRFNSASNQMRFRFFKSSTYTNQKAITLYKLVEE